MSDESWSSPFLAARAEGPSVRVALALDADLTLTRAQASVVDDICACEFAVIVAVLVTSARDADRPSLSDRVWRAYARMDRRRVHVADDPDRRQPIGARLGSLAPIRVSTRPGPMAKGGEPPQLGIERPDVIVDLRSSAAGDQATLAGFATNGVIALRRWIRLPDHVVAIALEQHRSAGAATRIAAGVFALDPLAVGPSIATAVYGSTHLVIQHLRGLHAAATGDPPPTVLQSDQGAADGRATPEIPEIVRCLAPVVARGLVRRIRRTVTRRTTRPHWRIALRGASSRDLLASNGSMSGFRWLEAPVGHAWADPFLIDHEGRTWLFFEDVAYGSGRASIACASLSSDAVIGEPITVLESDGHLSYPYVFLDGGIPYLIPESRDAGVVRLYRATDFPSTWEAVSDLYRGGAVDTSPVWHGDRWWFFTTIREPRAGATALMLFSAETLRGAWRAHPANPISLDVRTARGAGRIIRMGDRLIRPSQDGSRTYGYAFALNEIVSLSEDAYVERPLVTIGPDWSPGLDATHTYARLGSIEATDGRIERDRRQAEGRLTGR